MDLTRRQMAVNCIGHNWQVFAKANPQIDFGNSDLSTQAAEYELENQIADFIAGRIGLEQVKPAFDAWKEAYRQL